MAAWMLYATAVGAVFSVAAWLVESGLQHFERGSRRIRWVWAVAMAVTAVVPLVAGLRGSPVGPDAGGGGWPPGPGGTVLLLAWVAGAFALLANIRLSGWTVRRNARSWRSVRSMGRSVLVSAAFGPGVIGARRPRIVLPQWAVGSRPALRRLIVVHEEEHVRAGDTRLLLAAVVLVAFLPWCLPLWWQLNRLRGAIETDCDARVVSRTGDARAYAEALVTVAGHWSRSVLPVPALSPGHGELERRIRRLTGRADRRGHRGALGLALGAMLAAAAVIAIPAPDLPRPGFDLTRAPGPSAVVGPEATVILSVEPR